jgi:hypothetical protein
VHAAHTHAQGDTIEGPVLPKVPPKVRETKDAVLFALRKAAYDAAVVKYKAEMEAYINAGQKEREQRKRKERGAASSAAAATSSSGHIEQNDPKSHVNENYRCLWSSLMVPRSPGSLYSPITHITSPKTVTDHYVHTTDRAVHTRTPRAEMRKGVSQMVCAAIHTSYRTRLLVQHPQTTPKEPPWTPQWCMAFPPWPSQPAITCKLTRLTEGTVCVWLRRCK